MAEVVVQNSWVAGEINPNLTTDVDNELYYSSALEIKNMYISKSQTLKRVPGTEAVVFDPSEPAILGNTVITIGTKFEGVEFLIFTAQTESPDGFTCEIYTYNAQSNTAAFVQTYNDPTNQQFPFVDHVVFDDKIVFTFPDTLPLILTFTSTAPSDPTALIPFVFVNQPTLDFGEVDYASYLFVIPANAPAIVINVTGTGAGDDITTKWEGGMFYSLGDDTSEFLGQGKITDIVFVSANEFNMTVTVLHNFAVGTFTGARSVLQQPIFFDAAEAPQIVSYFDSRLYFGQTRSLPMLVCASRVNIANDFNVGKSLPAEAIVYLLNDSSSSFIAHIIGHIGLFIMTDQNEHVVVPSIELGITPEAFIAQRLSDWGSTDVPPTIFDQYIAFVDKTSRKIIRIDSSSSDSFSVKEITKGMDIAENIGNLGVINSPLIDVKLIAFSGAQLDSTVVGLITFQEEPVFGRTSYDFLPASLQENAQLNTPIQFIKIGNQTLLMAVNEATASPVLSMCAFVLPNTYVSDVGPIPGNPVTRTADSWAFTPPVGEGVVPTDVSFIPANVATTVPGAPSSVGFVVEVGIKSIPMTTNNQAAWDWKSISYLFVSYFNSAQFFVNGQAAAFPPLEDMGSPVSLKTSYDKFTYAAIAGKFNFLEITSSEPYNVEIQAYGWGIKTTIMI